jgi:hypothetical protein
MKKIARIAASTVVMTAGLGFAGLGAPAVAQAQPAPFPDYYWCPGQKWDPGWGDNWDMGRCHDDHWCDGEARDRVHWHNDPWDQDWHKGQAEIGSYFQLFAGDHRVNSDSR